MPDSIDTPRHRKLIELLIEYRIKAGLTQTELKEKLKVRHQSYVARLESGQRRVDVVELIMLSAILDFDAKEVIAKLEELN